MSTLTETPEIQKFLNKISGLDQGDATRLKQIVRRVVGDLFATIDDFDVTDEEFWQTLSFISQSAPEFGLWAAGFGVEHFLDLRADRADAAAGISGGTPRTIEGPLYVAGAPLEQGRARLDDGTDKGQLLVMQGQVRSADGTPLANAIVDVWHADTRGNYSHFDTSQSPYNYRRRIQTDGDGCYWFRSILPSGYAVPPGSGIEFALEAVGRHGNRPAHIHFFISASGHRHLTTQINIQGDAYLHDDFAYATRDELIPAVEQVTDAGRIQAADLDAPFASIIFDFVLQPAATAQDEHCPIRPRALHQG